MKQMSNLLFFGSRNLFKLIKVNKMSSLWDKYTIEYKRQAQSLQLNKKKAIIFMIWFLFFCLV